MIDVTVLKSNGNNALVEWIQNGIVLRGYVTVAQIVNGQVSSEDLSNSRLLGNGRAMMKRLNCSGLNTWIESIR